MTDCYYVIELAIWPTICDERGVCWYDYEIIESVGAPRGWDAVQS